jgi:hypothetical protein
MKKIFEEDSELVDNDFIANVGLENNREDADFIAGNQLSIEDKVEQRRLA